MAAVSRFAHLIGFGAKKAATDDKDDKSAASEKPTQNEGESDEDFEKRLKKWEDDQDDGEEAAAAETPKDTSDDDQDDGKKLKKAEADGFAKGFAAANTRWTDVLADKAAAGRLVAACNLLADTDMAAASITKTLAALPAETGRSTLAQRQPAPTPAPSPEGGTDPQAQDGPKGFAARMAATMAKVRPSKAA